MPSDYAKITEDNIRRRGTEFDDIGQMIAERLYSDRTHFVYELLQNAEDADATWIAFDLHPDRLDVRHNGRPFNEADVRAVCDVLRGTKADDEGKIGKFGIGFKSVFAFTSTPEIHSADENFVIKRYIHPHPIAPRAVGKGDTLFVFPFNHTTISANDAYSQIARRLDTLDERTLLFLRHLDAIEWTGNAGSGTYLRQVHADDISCRRVTLTSERVRSSPGKKSAIDEEWLVFDREAGGSEPTAPIMVEIAFRLTAGDQNGPQRIESIPDSRIVVFFRTDVQTRLGFLIQAPFRTTPSRDNISWPDPVNASLIQAIAELVKTTLPSLRSMGLLTVSAIDALIPRTVDSDTLAAIKTEPLAPVHERVRTELRTERLLPTSSGGHVAAVNSKIAEKAELTRLFQPDQLTDLVRSRSALQWLSSEITEGRTPRIYRYLVGRRPRWTGDRDGFESLIPELEIRAETVVKHLDSKFLAKQSFPWVGRLYDYLGDVREQFPTLRQKPIIPLTSGQWVSPFLPDGKARAYLPTKEPSEFPTVNPTVLTSDKAIAFLRGIGIQEPSVVSEVIDKILPRYFGSGTIRSGDEHASDVVKILAAWQNASPDERPALGDALRKFPWVRVEQQQPNDVRWVKPSSATIPDSATRLYFEGNREAHFCDELTKAHDLLVDLGTARGVEVKHRPANTQGYVNIATGYGDNRRGVDGFDPDCTIVGLEHALRHINRDKAAFIWNRLLVPNRNQIMGQIESASRKTFENKTTSWTYSMMGALVVRSAWLPTRAGKFSIPKDISFDDVPDDFERDDLVALFLGMRPSELGKVARIYKMNPEKMDRLLRAAAENPSEFDVLMNKLASSHQPLATEPVDFASDLAARFRRPRSGSGQRDRPPPPTPIPDIDRRRKQVDQEIEADRLDEPARFERFEHVPRVVWEKKNGEIRSFLMAQYDGACQICRGTFLKVDGEPYFEGLYLVPHHEARWIDRHGNVLCLCPTCCAKLLYGPVETDDDILDQVNAFRPVGEGGTANPKLRIRLCGEDVTITFSERHLLDLREMVRTSSVKPTQKAR